ncbi:MAG: hypothetical protein Q4E53_08790 [Eubacteriales bacterium]|nr:hypothetical protein [Eubacteriales bacterium]
MSNWYLLHVPSSELKDVPDIGMDLDRLLSLSRQCCRLAPLILDFFVVAA